MECTVDRARLAEGRAVLGACSASAAIDVALSEIIRRSRLRHDIEAYITTPPTEQEAAPGDLLLDSSDLADDTEWEAEWQRQAKTALAERRGEIWLADLDKRRPVMCSPGIPWAGSRIR
jgi:hypothetical protein